MWSVDGAFGILFERIDGPTMLDLRTVALIDGVAMPAGFTGPAPPPALRRAFREAYVDHSAAPRSLDHGRLIAWLRIHDAVVAVT